MFSHKRIWAAIDELAGSHRLTASGLAKRAGLDSTTFNKSKRFAPDGRARWPSTESIAKILEATGATTEEFMAFMTDQAGGPETVRYDRPPGEPLMGFQESSQAEYKVPPMTKSIPVLGLAQAGSGGFFDDAGYPIGEGWDHLEFPGAMAGRGRTYALEITGDSMLPLYRDGDRVIVSPDANVRKGDRVIVKTLDGEVMAKILKSRGATAYVLESVNPDYADLTIPADDVQWLARIVWASQ